MRTSTPSINIWSVRMERHRYEEGSPHQTGACRHEGGIEEVCPGAPLAGCVFRGVCSCFAASLRRDPNALAGCIPLGSLRGVRVFLPDIHAATGDLLLLRPCIFAVVPRRNAREDIALLPAGACKA